MERTIDICRMASISSTDFEKSNTDFKRRYLIYNIMLYNYVVAKTKKHHGTFGTGYPFYALNPDLTGNLPIIDEQIRYNNELLTAIQRCGYEDWECTECLQKNYNQMPDLKQKCKPCDKLDDALKPRKILNRLPDIDLWTICEEKEIEEIKEELSILFKEHDMQPSDINPVQTITDLTEIADDVRNGIIPKKALPLDAHIIGYSTLSSLIEQTPMIIEQALEEGKTPYLPIQPWSLRKKWQHDDTPYNFIHDYLYSFTDFDFDKELKELLTETRKIIASRYSTDELFELTTLTGADCVARRNKTKALRPYFNERIKSWQ